jgi:hypothetical protein
MFVSDFIELPGSPDEVTARVAAHHWEARDAVDDIDTGTPRARDDTTYVPVLWTLRDETGPVTVLVGDLEIAPGIDGGTVMGLVASYPTPRGAQRGDRTVHRRVARGVRAGLHRLGTSLACEEIEP